jgi:hypothetical protein
MVLPSIPETERASRLCVAAAFVDFLVSSMAVLSDFGRAVVLANVFRELIAPGAGYGSRFLGLRLGIFAGDHRCSGNATGSDSHQEIAAGELGCWSFHHILLFMK